MENKRFPARGQLIPPENLVEGWPVDYWRGYQHPTMQAQLERAMAEIRPKFDKWLEGKAAVTPGFLIYGKPGHGKSATGLTILDVAARQGYLCRFATAEHLAVERESTTYNAKDGTTALGLIDNLIAPELMMIDDIGTREYSGNVRAMFFDLIRERNSCGKITILTTNLLLNTTEGQQFFARSLDARILSTYQGFSFNSADWGTEAIPASSLRVSR